MSDPDEVERDARLPDRRAELLDRRLARDLRRDVRDAAGARPGRVARQERSAPEEEYREGDDRREPSGSIHLPTSRSCLSVVSRAWPPGSRPRAHERCRPARSAGREPQALLPALFTDMETDCRLDVYSSNDKLVVVTSCLCDIHARIICPGGAPGWRGPPFGNPLSHASRASGRDPAASSHSTILSSVHSEARQVCRTPKSTARGSSEDHSRVAISRGGRVRALCYERHGDPRNGVVKKVFDPRPGPGQLLVRVVAAALNPVDWKIVEGKFPFLAFPKKPFVPGCEAAGVVEAMDSRVSGFRVGDEVVVSTGLGGAARGEGRRLGPPRRRRSPRPCRSRRPPRSPPRGRRPCRRFATPRGCAPGSGSS